MIIPHPQHLPHPSGDLLYRSAHHPAHAGIPLVAPWFAQTLGPDMHGWAQRLPWQREGTTYRLHHDDFTLAFTGSNGEYTLSLRNDASVARPAQLAFHPYWCISDAQAVTITGLEGSSYFDKTTNAERTLDSPIRLGKETDALIAATGPVTLQDTHRTITLSASGIDHWVVWNPGPDACRQAPDLDDDEWHRFVCIEPALLGQDREGTEVAPGQHISITLEVSARAHA